MSARARVRVGVRVGIRVLVGLRLRAQSSEWRKGLGPRVRDVEKGWCETQGL